MLFDPSGLLAEPTVTVLGGGSAFRSAVLPVPADLEDTVLGGGSALRSLLPEPWVPSSALSPVPILLVAHGGRGSHR